jgi:hypothetical protein
MAAKWSDESILDIVDSLCRANIRPLVHAARRHHNYTGNHVRYHELMNLYLTMKGKKLSDYPKATGGGVQVDHPLPADYVQRREAAKFTAKGSKPALEVERVKGRPITPPEDGLTEMQRTIREAKLRERRLRHGFAIQRSRRDR